MLKQNFVGGVIIGAVGGVLIGAIGGAIAGVLMAPDSGEETRASLREQADGLKAKARAGGRHLIDSAHELLEQGKDQVSDLVRVGSNQAEALGKSVEKSA